MLGIRVSVHGRRFLPTPNAVRALGRRWDKVSSAVWSVPAAADLSPLSHRRYGIPVAAEVLSDSKEGWTGPPDPDTMTAPHTAVAYLTT